MQECKRFAAERAAPDVDNLSKDTNGALDGPLSAHVAPAHDVPMCVLTSVVNAVCSDFKVRHMYAEQHKGALAAVGPVLDGILCDAEHIARREVGRRPSSSSHWDLEVRAPVPVEHRDMQGWHMRERIPYLALELFLSASVTSLEQGGHFVKNRLCS